MRSLAPTLVLGLALGLSACGSNVEQRAASGGLGGAVIGAAIGGLPGAAIGGIAGAGAGTLIAHGYLDEARARAAAGEAAAEEGTAADEAAGDPPRPLRP